MKTIVNNIGICRVRTCALVRVTELKSVALDHSAKIPLKY